MVRRTTDRRSRVWFRGVTKVQHGTPHCYNKVYPQSPTFPLPRTSLRRYAGSFIAFAIFYSLVYPCTTADSDPRSLLSTILPQNMAFSHYRLKSSTAFPTTQVGSFSFPTGSVDDWDSLLRSSHLPITSRGGWTSAGHCTGKARSRRDACL